METKAQNNQHFRAMNLFLVNIGTPGKLTDTYWHFYRKVASFEQKGYTFLTEGYTFLAPVPLKRQSK